MIATRFKIFVQVLCISITGLSHLACTSSRPHSYRDESLLETYRYALGERYLEVDGLRLCYQEHGAGETVLIIPGLGTSIDFWQHNIPALAKRYHVLAIDPPGFGKSDKPDVDYDLPWIADKIVAFMDAKGIERAHVIGGSMGGHLALILTLGHPQRVDKLVLMGAVGDWSPPGPLGELALRTLWNDRIVAAILRQRWPSLYQEMFARPTPLTESIYQYHMAIRANPQAYAPVGRAKARALRSIILNSCSHRLGEIAAPTLLIWGALDKYQKPCHGMNFRRRLPHSRLVVLFNSAHEPMVDQPGDFNRLVLDFLQGGLDAAPDFYPCELELCR